MRISSQLVLAVLMSINLSLTVSAAAGEISEDAAIVQEPARARIPIVVQPAKTLDETWPVTLGIPFPDGVLRSAENVRLLDPQESEVPCQVRVTALWSPKGFIKWLLLDFLAQVSAQKPATYQLEYGTMIRRHESSSPLRVEDNPNALTVTTGPLRFVLRKDRFRFLDSVWLDVNEDGQFEDAEQVVRAGNGSGAYFVDHTGVRYGSANAKPDEFQIEESGPKRLVIKVSGWQTAADGKRRLGRYVNRIYAYAGQPYLRVFHTLIIAADSRKVRYRDIALETTLTQVNQCAVGTESGGAYKGGSQLSLVQDAWDHFLVRGADPEVKGEHAEGWIRANGVKAGLTVAVRDFWQNYPSELELADNRLIIHFWPAHNAPRKHTLENTDRFNIQMLWFAHEGKELDFTIPADYPAKFNRENRDEFYYIPNATQNANAIGVAKTHEMLYFFHPANAPASRVAATVRTFQEGVACMATPEWVCGTEAFGSMPMQPRDPEQFPQAEWAISAMFDCERRLENYTHDYGMWVFGSGHNEWDTVEKRWKTNRVWRNMHHGSPRVAWLLYARSGDPKYLTRARRNTRHNMDIGFCHYSTPEFEALSYPQQKIKGALTDYKGLVPWHSGGRLFDYNCMADFLLYNYYITGDRRGLDVLDEWIEAAVARFRKARDHREGAGVLATCLAAYQHTWDERLRRLIDQYADTMIGSQQPDGSIPGWAEYAPWLNRLHKFTGSAESEKCLEKWCDWYVDSLKTAQSYRYREHLWPAEYGYHVFKREEYLAVQTGFLRIALNSIYRNPGHFYDGYWTSGPSHDMGYLLQELPFFLYSLAQHSKPVIPTYYGVQELELQTGKFRVIALDEEDKAFQFHWYGRVREKPTLFTLVAPNGEVIRTGSLEPDDDKDVVMEVPADGMRGEYVLTLEVGRSLSLSLPMTDLPKEVFDTRHQRVTLLRAPRVRFFVPEDCFQAKLIVGQHTEPNVVSIYDGQDELAARGQWLGTEKRTMTMELAPRPDQRDELWAIHFGRKIKRSFLTLAKPLPPYISISRDQFFLPRDKNVNQKD